MNFKNLKGFIQHHKAGTGFTLIELIIVIAIIALLAAATFVAVNPAKRIGDANNAQRWSDVTALGDAWATYIADNTGTTVTTTALVSGTTYAITTTTVAWGSSSCAATSTSAMIVLDGLVSAGYVGAIPVDPSLTVNDRTGYYLYYEDGTTASGVMKVGACDTYSTGAIEIIR